MRKRDRWLETAVSAINDNLELPWETYPCILWPFRRKGIDTGDCYGIVWYGEKIMSAHRAAWLIANGPIPEKLCVLHRCDVRRCVRPSHLFLGTRADNMADCLSKGRMRRRTHKLTATEVLSIRQRCDSGERHRSIAQSVGLNEQYVSKIVNCKTWKKL